MNANRSAVAALVVANAIVPDRENQKVAIQGNTVQQANFL
jgi:hypothetical protein